MKFTFNFDCIGTFDKFMLSTIIVIVVCIFRRVSRYDAENLSVSAVEASAYTSKDTFPGLSSSTDTTPKAVKRKVILVVHEKS